MSWEDFKEGGQEQVATRPQDAKRASLKCSRNHKKRENTIFPRPKTNQNGQIPEIENTQNGQNSKNKNTQNVFF
jgi:hypothetical protein